MSSSGVDRKDMNVLLFGRTGDGKSTLANMLVLGNLEEPIFRMGNGLNPVTSDCKVSSGRGYRVVDTVGLGEETDLERVDPKELIYEYLKENRGSYSHIVFVKRAGRVDALDEAIWASFKEVFEGAEWAFMVVITHCEEPKGWLEANSERLYEIYGQKTPYAFVDLPPVHSSNPVAENARQAVRKTSLSELEEVIDARYRVNQRASFELNFTGLNDFQLRERAEIIWSIIKPFLKALSKLSNWKKLYNSLWLTLSRI